MIELSIWTSIFLGVVQGLTEFLPISSSGHLILAREVLSVRTEGDLTFDALLHFATAAAIVTYFWQDIFKLIKVFFSKRLFSGAGEDVQMVYALIAGTIPAALFGYFLEEIMETLFRNPLLVAGALVVGSLIMLCAEKYSGSLKSILSIFENGWKRGLVIGLFQSLALVPGMSRSGMTISGGMLLGLSRDVAATFGFLLGVPVLLGAGLKKALELGAVGFTFEVIAGSAVAFVVAIAVIHYLLRFLRNHTLHVFIWYRLALVIVVVLLVV